MGDPKKLRKKYELPRHPWEKTRILEENELIKEFGLKNKKEIWVAKSEIRKYRHMARELVGLTEEERKTKQQVLLQKLTRLGILPENGTLDNILSLKVQDLLERRLQTRVWKLGLSRTSIQARQMITHGHIAIDGKKNNAPGTIINVEQEKRISWYKLPIQILPPGAKPNTTEMTAIQDLAIKTMPTPEETKAAEEVQEKAHETITQIAKEAKKDKPTEKLEKKAAKKTAKQAQVEKK